MNVTADCYRELLLRVMLMHLVISSLLSIPAYSLRIFVIRFSINPITAPDTINYVKNIKNVGSITNQERHDHRRVHSPVLSSQLIETENWRTILERVVPGRNPEESYRWFAHPRFQTQPLSHSLASSSTTSKIRIYRDAGYDGNSPNLDH